MSSNKRSGVNMAFLVLAAYFVALAVAEEIGCSAGVPGTDTGKASALLQVSFKGTEVNTLSTKTPDASPSSKDEEPAQQPNGTKSDPALLQFDSQEYLCLYTLTVTRTFGQPWSMYVR